jgi:hypothetical protein
MAIAYKIGDTVRQVVPIIEGKVISVAIIDGDVQFEVAYDGADGEPHSRFFKEDELNTVAE